MMCDFMGQIYSRPIEDLVREFGYISHWTIFSNAKSMFELINFKLKSIYKRKS